MPDNIPIILGTGNDAEIVHNGNDNYFRILIGNLHVNTGTSNVFTVLRTNGQALIGSNVAYHVGNIGELRANSNMLASAVSLILYNSAGTAVKTLFGAGV